MSYIYPDEETRKMMIDSEQKAEDNREELVKKIKDMIGDIDWDNLNARQLLHIDRSLKIIDNDRWEEFWNKEWE